MTAPVDIDELERLLGAVTDEPWAALPGSALMVQGDEYRGPPVAEFERPGDHYCDPLQWPIATREERDTWDGRLRLVVALRNSAPALLAELRAARDTITILAAERARLYGETTAGLHCDACGWVGAPGAAACQTCKGDRGVKVLTARKAFEMLVVAREMLGSAVSCIDSMAHAVADASGFEGKRDEDAEELVEHVRRQAIELKAAREEIDVKAERIAGLERAAFLAAQRRFPIIGVSAPNCPRSVPWSLIEHHEEQAQHNHQQSLSRLAERGGLSPCEFLAVVENRQWHRMPPEESTAHLNALVAKHAAKHGGA